MKKNIHYPKAPIMEAVIDFQLLPNKEFKKSFYNKIQKAVLPDLTVRKELASITAQLNIGQKGKVVSHHKVDGIRLESPDGKYILQARENRFTFSIVKTYDKWETFSAEGLKYWKIYRGIFKPNKVMRQAIRYINRIDIPAQNIDLADYFNIYPSVFEHDKSVGEKGHSVQNYFLQVQMRQSDGGLAVITQSPSPVSKPGETSIILDIDIFDTLEVAPSSAKLVQRIEKFRDQKNRIFELSISDKIRELIK